MGRPAGWMLKLTGRGADALYATVHRRFGVRWSGGSGSRSQPGAQARGLPKRWAYRQLSARAGSGIVAACHCSCTNLFPERYLSFAEREIGLLREPRTLVCGEIARRIGRSPSTVSRELKRNAATRGEQARISAVCCAVEVRAGCQKAEASEASDERSEGFFPPTSKTAWRGKIHDAAGREVAGPRQAPFQGRNKPHRGDLEMGQWLVARTDCQPAARLGFPDDNSMRISHEAIYQALYIPGRGALKRELVHCLRTGRALRVPRSGARPRVMGTRERGVMISSRPRGG